MRLESVTVRNYRLHRECRVEFDPERTLVGGPNETGKSTLIEAAHRALFLRAKTGGEVQRSMISRSHSGQPEVEVAFSSRGARWRVLKRFSGASGTATLTEIGGSSWSNDAAEEKLSELIGTPSVTGAGARRVAEQWAHLWIWQGCAGDDPTAHADTHCSDLLSRLQREGGAAVVQSANDQRLAATIAARHGELFKENGDARAGSALAQAQAAEAQARAAVETSRATLSRLAAASGDFLAAVEEMRSAAQELAGLVPQQREVEEKLARVAGLRAEEKLQAPAATTAAEKLAAAADADARIRRLRADAAEATAALEPLAAETARLAAAEAERARTAAEAETAEEKATAAARAARLASELATACAQRFEKAAELAHRRTRFAQVQTLREESRRLSAALAEVPAITTAKLQALQKLERDLGQAIAARDAMATGVEVLAADLPLRLGERELGLGASEILSDEAVLEIGDGVRIRIRPGGGTRLADARQSAWQAGAALRAELDRAGLTDVEAAAGALATRQDLQAQLKGAAGRLDDLAAEKIEDELAAAERSCATAEAEIERRRALTPETPLPPTAEAARELVQTSSETLQHCERLAFAASAERKAAAERWREAGAQLEAHTQAIERRRQTATDLAAQLRLLLERHGDDDARARQLSLLAGEKSGAETALAATRAALAALQPALLEGEQEMLARAVNRQLARQKSAEESRSRAHWELQRDGTTDPYADCALAEAASEAARASLAREQQRAGAVRLLHELFRAEQQALAAQFTEPLAARISAYLECLFGPGARAQVTFESGRFGGLRLVRPGDGSAAFAFDDLSGGTREQLAAAVRLALAEVLAETHDGCLPVVFDDAFAYSDPTRVRVLQRMLDVAAQRGLQVIVLSCNPADYAPLGAKQITLRRDQSSTLPSARSETATDRREPASSPVGPVAPALPISEAQRTELLFRLHALGGSCGNHALRDDLGWSAEIYDAVKLDLLSRNELRAGRGRGGSISLVEPE